MDRRLERVIATLVVWLAVMTAFIHMSGKLSSTYIYPQSLYFYPNGIVTGATSEEVGRLIDSFPNFSSELYNQVTQVAQTEMLTYLPYLLVIGAVLLLGGVLSTMFIWRSVIVPAELSERFTSVGEKVERPYRPMKVRLDDDGELIHPEMDSQPNQNHR